MMLRSVGLAALLLTLGDAPIGGPAYGGTLTIAAPESGVDVRLMDLITVRRLLTAAARERGSMREGERVAAWADFALLVEAVTGTERVHTVAFDDLAVATATDRGPRVSAAPGVIRRDAVAYQMLALGYSARETADVISGRITQHALDTARRMLALGQGRDTAANYLDSQYKRVMALRDRQRTPQPGRRERTPTRFDGFIERYASLHNVEVALVRAIIATESAFNPLARSHAGAIGLMQLMPTTARELGVNPFVVEQNIEGGVRYFSELLKMFGGVELALVAYNAGPGFARRYARGQIALYGETREYVKRVLARFSAQR